MDGYYTLGIPGTVHWYSYLPNGDWDNPDTWTTDPSGTLYYNDFAQTPSAIDEVTILNGKTVNISTNTKEVSILEIEEGAILDQGATFGHTFSTITGGGKLRLSGDNFPLYASKADFDTRGTTEYYGGSYDLANDETYFNLIINLDNAANQVTVLSDLTTEGLFEIESGIVQINDNSSTSRILDINDDLLVGNNGQLLVNGSSQVTHEINIAGDFTNNGICKFSDLSGYDYSGGTHTVKANVTFDNSRSNQSVYLDGITDFYRIVSDKGVDQTYIVEFTATNTANFNLYGQNSQSGPGNGTSVSPQALGIKSGTVKLSSNIFIPELKTGSGNYDIPESGALWVNSADVRMSGETALVVYGRLKVSGAAGNLYVSSSSGLTMRETGIFEVENGTVNINQFRRSTNAGDHFGVYKQSGGYVTVARIGGAPSSSFYLFDLAETSHSFIMTGGTLHVKRGSENVKGGIYINSTEDKVNVTGGTIICETTGNKDFKISTRAPFNNVTFINSTGVDRDFDIQGGSTGAGGANTTLNDTTFVVLGDFNISTPNINFDNNGLDIKYYGDVYVESGSTYDIADNQNTTYFFGGSSEINFQHLIGSESEYFSRVIIDKDETFGDTDTLTLVANTSNKALTGYDNDLISINKSLYLNNGVLNQSYYSVLLSCDTVYNDGQLGYRVGSGSGTDVNPNSDNDRIRIHDNGATTYMYSENGDFGSVELKTSDNILEMTSRLRSIDRFYFRSGRLYANNNRIQIGTIREEFDPLEADGDTPGDCAGCYSKNDMIILGGSASDEGLGLNWGGSVGSFTYPIGTGTNPATAKYTPVTYIITTDRGAARNRTNYVSIGDAILPTTNPSGGESILSYYWAMNHGFNGSNNPYISSIEFTYNDADDDDGLIATFVPGQVLNDSPFSREVNTGGTINTTTKVITFDFTGENSGDGRLCEEANYTAGDVVRFSGVVEEFFSCGSGGTLSWSDPNSWSNVGHYDSAPRASTIPTEGSIVYIGFDPDIDDAGGNGAHNMEMDVANVDVAQVWMATEATLSGGGIDVKSRGSIKLTIKSTVDTARLGTVANYPIGTGRSTEIAVEVSCTTCDIDPTISVAEVPVIIGDFNDFSVNGSDWNIWEYNLQMPTNTSVYLPEIYPSDYPRLDIYGNNIPGQSIIFTQDITVRSRMRLHQEANIILNDGVNGDIEVLQGIRLDNGGNQAERITFPSTGSARTFTVGGYMRFDHANDGIYIDNTTPSGLLHRFVYNSERDNSNNEIIDVRNGAIDLYNTGANANQGVFVIASTIDAHFISNESSISEFYKIEVNQHDTAEFEFRNNFLLSGDASGSEKPLELVSGKLILNDSDIDIEVSTGGDDFVIPQGTTLELVSGTVSVNSINSRTGMLLDGVLEITGTDALFSLDSGNVSYTTSGFSSVNITEGQFFVGGRFMRDLDDDQSNVRYTESGGIARFGVNQVDPTYNGVDYTSRGVFEVIGVTSVFEHSAGDIIVERGNNSSTVGDVSFSQLPSGNANSTGNFVIGATTATPSGQLISVNLADATINKVLISGVSSATAEAIIKDWDVNYIEIENGGVLEMNDFDLTISTEFLNSAGSVGFIPGDNTTNLVGATVNVIGDTEFNNVYANTTSRVQLGTNNTEITVQEMELTLNGRVYDGGNVIHVKKDLTNSGRFYSEGSTSGVKFDGDVAQVIYSDKIVGFRNESSFDRIMIDNPQTVKLGRVDKRHFMNVYDDLELLSGVFYLVDDRITLWGEGVTGSDFSNSKMIRVAGTEASENVNVFVKSETKSMTIPLGVNEKYTPVTFTATATGNSFYNFRSIEGQHLTTLPYSGNLLHHFWKVKTSGGTDHSVDITLNYSQSDVVGVESDYGSAYLADADWTLLQRILGENPSAGVDTLTNEITFSFSDPSSLSIDMTCGDTKTPDPGNAFPLNIPEYESINTGDWDVATNWMKDGNPVDNEVPELGSIVIIANGDAITFIDDAVQIYSLEVNGELEVGNTIKHNLGTISGSGTVKLTDGLLPGGNYETFLTDTTGSVSLGGTGTYTIDARIVAVKNATFEGTGTRNIPNLSMSIGGDLVIDGVTVDNLGGTDTRVQGNIELQNGGSFLANGGGFELYGDSDSRMIGDFTGANQLNTLVINKNSALNDSVYLDNDVDIATSLTFTKGIISSGNNTIKLANGIVFPTAAWDSSYVEGDACTDFLVGQGSALSFPIGDNFKYATCRVIDVSAGEWCANYNDGNPSGDGFNVANLNPTDDPIINSVGTNGYWEITGPNSATASNVALTWVESGTIAEPTKVVVAEWDAGNSYWTSRSGTYSPGTKELLSGDAIGFSTKQFAFASVDVPLPVELINYNVKLSKENVHVSWTTLSEKDNDYFEVQRSLDGVNFEYVGYVEGAGSSNDVLDYSFVDYSPLSGVSYYRVKQVDYDGQFEYTEIKFVVIESDEELLAVLYPNPSDKGEERLLQVNGNTDNLKLAIYDALGNEVYLDSKVSLTDGYYSLPYNLNSGVYILKLISLNKSLLIRFVVK